MATIVLRDIPEELMEQIRQSAALERRSIPAEVLHLTELGIWYTKRQRDHARAIESMRQRLAEKPCFSVSSTELIDKDRQQ